MTASPSIRIAAALIMRPDGRTLVVRKRGTAVFMQPGGKIERGEAPAEALARELREELGLVIDAKAAPCLGQHAARAALEPDVMVQAEVFRVDIGSGDGVRAAAEIEELRWIDPTAPGDVSLAALTRDHILPLCRTAHGA